MDYIIERREAEEIKKDKGWSLIYGRRKTGKTFILNKLCKFKNYFLVKKELSVLYDEKTISIDEMKKLVIELLKNKKTVVIDEFQRLNESVLEEIVLQHPLGRLIISGSSMRIVKKVFDYNSPLLGFFLARRIELIHPIDIINSLKFKSEKKIELGTFLRDPWIIPSLKEDNIIDFIFKIITHSKYMMSSLIGEIFSEEERELTQKYQVIMKLIGAGVWNTTDLANDLYNKKVFDTPGISHLGPYLKNLQDMELLESIKINKTKNKHYYRLKSPIMNVYHYLDSRYDISTRNCSLNEIEPTLQKLIHFEIQNFVADLFADKYEGRKEYYFSNSKEIDFIITKRNKPIIVGEVKWKTITKEDVTKFKETVNDFHCRKVLICKKGIKDDEIEVIDDEGILKL